MGGDGQNWQKCLYLRRFLLSLLVASHYFPSSVQSILSQLLARGVPQWGTLGLETPSRNITSAIPWPMPMPWRYQCQIRAPGEDLSLLCWIPHFDLRPAPASTERLQGSCPSLSHGREQLPATRKGTKLVTALLTSPPALH